MPRIAVSGRLLCTASDLPIVSRLLPEHVRLTRAEPGCLAFHVVPSPNDPAVYLVDEVFENRAAFEAHQHRTRASAWGRATAHIPREFAIEERN